MILRTGSNRRSVFAPGWRHPSGENIRNGDHGFTLIEVLIAVMVLSVGIVLILQSLHAVMYSWEGGATRLRDTMNAQEALARAVQAADIGVEPETEPGVLDVEANVDGHPGLFRVVYAGGASRAGSSSMLETRVYVPPDGKRGQP